MKYPTYMLEGGTLLKLGTQNELSKHKALIAPDFKTSLFISCGSTWQSKTRGPI